MAVVNRGIASVGDVARGAQTATIPTSAALADGDGPDVAPLVAEQRDLSEAPIETVDESAPTPGPTSSTTTVAPPTTSVIVVTTTARAVVEPSQDPPVTAPTTNVTTTTTSTTTTIAPTTTAPTLRVTHVTSAGTAWVLYSPNSVTLDTAIPDDGYHTEVKQIDRLTVEVHFEANDDSHEVVLIATWSDGPSHSIEHHSG